MKTLIKAGLMLGLIYGAVTLAVTPYTVCHGEDLGGAVCTFHAIKSTDNKSLTTFYCSVDPSLKSNNAQIYIRGYNVNIRGFSPNETLITDIHTLNKYHFEVHYKDVDLSDSRIVAFEAGHVNGYQVICFPGDGGRLTFR